ncbi:MAG: HAD-IB family hydrolase [Ilumatobacteraceae bacterium]
MHPDVVAFDVDGTLTVRDCVFPWLAGVAGPVRTARTLAGMTPLLSVRDAATRRDRAKRSIVRGCVAGLAEDGLRDRGEHFAGRVAARWMREDVVRRLRAHQDAGDVVVLVSASLDAYLEPLGDILEVDAVLCTRLEYADGVATGEIVGGNCRGSEKVRRIAEWAGSAGFGGEGWLAAAYGDSSGDDEMLAMAREAVRVGARDLVS